MATGTAIDAGDVLRRLDAERRRLARDGEVIDALPELAKVRVGLLHLFIRHTSASLTINENADPDVAFDLEQAVNDVAPEDFPYVHTVEGPDDMPAHVKSVLIGSSVSIPIRDGRRATAPELRGSAPRAPRARRDERPRFAGQASRARRSPVNCQRACGGKKLR